MRAFSKLREKPKYADRLWQELNQFSKEQRKRIYNNLYAIELTDGCSNGCGFCGFNSKYGVRNVMPYPALELIADEITQLTDRVTSSSNGCGLAYEPREIMLYEATDPLDYGYEDYDYFDVLELFSQKGLKVITSTAVPVGKEELAIANLDDIRQISISHMNRERLEPYFERLGVSTYLDLFNYYVFKGDLQEDEHAYRKFNVQVNGTVEETIMELQKEDPSLPCEARFYDLRIDGKKPRHEVQTGENLFIFCADKDSQEGVVSDRDYKGVKNFGRAFHMEPYIQSPFAFGASGVKITPNGVFNEFCIPPSENNTSGKIIRRITPDNFIAIAMEHCPHYGSDHLIKRLLHYDV